jgi:hypothetical protein
MIHELHLQQVGPAPRFDIEFTDRLNLFTGDNGLGKTFLLDVAWWALTGTWSGSPAWPGKRKIILRRRDSSMVEPTISYHLAGKTGKTKELTTCNFDYSHQVWSRPQARPPIPGMVVYIRVDGSFSVWDPARNYWKTLQTKGVEQPDRPKAYHFSPDALWNGLEEDKRILCNGLIRDWVSWQNQPDQDKTSPFSLLSSVINQLSPHPSEWMKPGKPVRVSLEDVRDIPTIDLPYGSVPVIHASAGMKRILSLAYLLVWTWYEHVKASELLGQAPTNQLILLMDEVESHLHPQWQRSIVPAILGVANGLNKKIKTQVVATTHSPLVLASVEPDFSETKDKLFLFSLEGGSVSLEELPWAKQGDAVNWLVSDVFGLKQARSREAEIAIEAAEAFMRGDNAELPPRLATKSQIHKELVRVLAGNDPFWPRWVVKVMEGGK